MRRTSFLTTIVVLGFFQAALGQRTAREGAGGAVTLEAQPDIPRRALSNVPGPWQDYRVGAGDTLEIQVVDHVELNQTVRVSASGEITIHPAGTVQVSDVTAAELEARIASLLQEKKLVLQPEVLVFVKEYQSKRIYMIGEFARAGELVMSQHLTVTDAIFLAGGLTPLADRYGYLHRRVTKGSADGPPPASVAEKPDVPREGTEIIRIDLQPLEDGRIPEPDATLRHGDFLIVPARQVQFYFVIGEVMQPRNYAFPPGQTLMVSQAISNAGGPTKTAKMSKGVLIHYDRDGRRQESKVDFAAILKGKQKDFEVRPNDVIFVPGSKIKTITEGYIMTTAAMVEGTAFRIGRHYQLPDRPSSENP